jgi:hypothetical protein
MATQGEKSFATFRHLLDHFSDLCQSQVKN